MNDLFSFLCKRPTNCLSPFRAVASTPPEIELDGHATSDDACVDNQLTIEGVNHIRVSFCLFCHCGGDAFSVQAFAWQTAPPNRATINLSPLFLECRRCGKIGLVFDSDIHRADAGCGVRTNRRAEGDRYTPKCQCGSSSLGIFVSLEYGDLFDFRSVSFVGREQDLFSWFDLIGNCNRCTTVFPIASFECA